MSFKRVSLVEYACQIRNPSLYGWNNMAKIKVLAQNIDTKLKTQTDR